MNSAEDLAVRAEVHRRELRVHCYRLTGSFDEAEDLVQETLLSVASVSSALQRARPSLRRHLPEDRSQWRSEGPAPEERKVLDVYLAVSQSAGLDAVAGLLTSDVVLTMPPNPFWFTSRDAMMTFVRPSLDPASPAYFGEWKHLPATASRMPAVAGYVRRPGTTIFRAQTLDVLRVQEGKIAGITTFEPYLLAAFGLPLVIR